MRVRFLAAQASFGEMNDHALESISGIRVIRSYVQEDHDLIAFDKVTSDVMNKNQTRVDAECAFSAAYLVDCWSKLFDRHWIWLLYGLS